MKRLVFSMIVMTVSLLACWAAEPLESKTLEVALDLSPESATTWYDFGFSSTQVGSGKEDTPIEYEPTPITSVSLDFDDEGLGADRIAENADGSLWVYWHITSGSGLQISISGDDDMQKDSPASDEEKITWNIGIESSDVKGRGEEQIVFTHDPSQNGVGAVGSKKISLSTDELTGLMLTPGEYKANLVLSIKKI